MRHWMGLRSLNAILPCWSCLSYFIVCTLQFLIQITIYIFDKAIRLAYKTIFKWVKLYHQNVTMKTNILRVYEKKNNLNASNNLHITVYVINDFILQYLSPYFYCVTNAIYLFLVHLTTKWSRWGIVIGLCRAMCVVINWVVNSIAVTVLIGSSSNFVRMFVLLKYRSSSKMGHLESMVTGAKNRKILLTLLWLQFESSILEMC
jgi:hypothetical protein